MSSKAQDSADLFHQKAMDIAKGPFKELFMKAFMMWMIGNSINIFTIFAVSTALTQPIKAIMDTNTGVLAWRVLLGAVDALLGFTSRF